MRSNNASFDEYEEEKEHSWDDTREWQSSTTVFSPVSESDSEIPPPPASDHSSCSTRTSSSSANDAELSISSSPPPPTSDRSCSTSSSPQPVVDCSSANSIESLHLSTFHNPGGQWSTNAAAAVSVGVGRVFAVDKSLKDRSSSVSGLYDFDDLLEGDLSSSSSSSSSIPCNDMDPLGKDTNLCLSRSLVVMRLFSLRCALDHWKVVTAREKEKCKQMQRQKACLQLASFAKRRNTRQSFVLWRESNERIAWQESVLDVICQRRLTNVVQAWREVTAKSVMRRQTCFLMMIFNRWKLLAEKASEERQKSYAALVHLAMKIARKAFSALKLHAAARREDRKKHLSYHRHLRSPLSSFSSNPLTTPDYMSRRTATSLFQTTLPSHVGRAQKFHFLQSRPNETLMYPGMKTQLKRSSQIQIPLRPTNSPQQQINTQMDFSIPFGCADEIV